MAIDVTDTVQYNDKKGMVIEKYTENTEWTPDPENDDEYYEIEASEEDPVFLVALEDGNTKPLLESQVKSADWSDVSGEMPLDEVNEEAPKAQLSDTYHKVDDAAELEQFMDARDELGHISTEYKEASLASPAIDLPGANTAGIGFSEDPPGWDRSSYLKAWSTFKGKWRICYPRMIRHFGPRMAKRWCS